jgi:hypothetical protein
MIAWLETVLASPRLGILATIAFVWLVGLLTGVMISGRPRNRRTAEPDDIETFADPKMASLECHYQEWQAHQLLEDHRNARH